MARRDEKTDLGIGYLDSVGSREMENVVQDELNLKLITGDT